MEFDFGEISDGHVAVTIHVSGHHAPLRGRVVVRATDCPNCPAATRIVHQDQDADGVGLLSSAREGTFCTEQRISNYRACHV